MPFNKQRINQLANNFLFDLDGQPEMKDENESRKNFMQLMKGFERKFIENYEVQLKENMHELESKFKQKDHVQSESDKRLAMSMGIPLPMDQNENANFPICCKHENARETNAIAYQKRRYR